MTGNRSALCKGLEIGLTTEVLQVIVVDDKGRGKHRGGEFAAVGAIADK